MKSLALGAEKLSRDESTPTMTTQQGVGNPTRRRGTISVPGQLFYRQKAERCWM